jgi:hypothetical protein
MAELLRNGEVGDFLAFDADHQTGFRSAITFQVWRERLKAK